jgi:hypothetical protein
MFEQAMNMLRSSYRWKTEMFYRPIKKGYSANGSRRNNACTVYHGMIKYKPDFDSIRG